MAKGPDRRSGLFFVRSAECGVRESGPPFRPRKGARGYGERPVWSLGVESQESYDQKDRTRNGGQWALRRYFLSDDSRLPDSRPVPIPPNPLSRTKGGA